MNLRECAPAHSRAEPGRLISIGQGRALCAALAAYFFCTELRIKKIRLYRIFLTYSINSHIPSKLHTRNLSSILLPIHLWSCPRPISCGQLHTLLHFHLRPIYLVVFKGSYYLLVGISHLEGGFTLRCLQRLSPPGLATLPWP